jgi:DNA-nicking Smr family endonuclease
VAIQIPIEDSFDLHSFLPRDVPSVLAAYLEEAHRKGMHEVRVIHGKGIGTRRAQVRKLLGENELVSDYFDAPPDRGSLGATIVLLKP